LHQNDPFKEGAGRLNHLCSLVIKYFAVVNLTIEKMTLRRAMAGRLGITPHSLDSWMKKFGPDEAKHQELDEAQLSCRLGYTGANEERFICTGARL